MNNIDQMTKNAISERDKSRRVIKIFSIVTIICVVSVFSFLNLKEERVENSITIMYSGEQIKIFYFERDKYNSILEGTYEIDENDIIDLNGDKVTREKLFKSTIKHTDVLTVDIVDIETITEQIQIDFETTTQETYDLNNGESRVVSDGVPGAMDVTYELTYINSSQTSKVKVKEEIVKDPINAIELIGIASNNNGGASSGGSASTESKPNVNENSSEPNNSVDQGDEEECSITINGEKYSC